MVGTLASHSADLCSDPRGTHKTPPAIIRMYAPHRNAVGTVYAPWGAAFNLAGFHLSIKGIELDSSGLAFFHEAAKVNPHPQGKQLRVLATLYDGHTASVFGSQCTSLPTWLPAKGVPSDSLMNLNFDVFWHSQVWDPKVSLLLQFTLATRDEKGALVDEYCVAWSRLDLVQVLPPKRIIHFTFELVRQSIVQLL